MTTGARIGLLIALLAAVAVGYGWLTSGDGDNAKDIKIKREETVPLPPIPDGSGPLELDHPDTCQRCHPAIYEEWKRSHHAMSWVNPEPRRKELSDNFKNRDCISCHAPRPALEVGYGKRALERGVRRETGVDCFSCHKHKNAMVGANALSPAAAGAPCNPVTWEPFAEMTLCFPCHDQHKVHQHWMSSRFAVEGPGYKDCNDCHMPERHGPATLGSSRKSHRSHVFGGGNDPEMIKMAATLRIEEMGESETLGASALRVAGRTWESSSASRVPGGGLMIEVKNTGAGHNFPEDERHRAVDLELVFIPEGEAAGKSLRITRFRNPYRHEFEVLNPFADRVGEVLEFDHEWEGKPLKSLQVRLDPEFKSDRKIHYPKSTQLQPNESRLVWLPNPFDKKGRIVATLYYKKNPFLKNEEAVIAAQEILNVGR